MFGADLWIPITISAALFQTWRTALQQKLRGALSVNAAAFVRFLYGAPFAALFLAAWSGATGQVPPAAHAWFVLLCAAGGLAQIIGTSLLIRAFGYRNFAVGTAYSKTEAVQGAVAAWIILGEALSPLAWGGIALGVAGVLVLSLPKQGMALGELARGVAQPAALCGLGAGAGFALSAVFFKMANFALPGEDPILRALATLLVTNVLQTLMLGAWLARAEPEQFRLSFASWRSAAWVGLLSACGSSCWFSAFALAPVALVRALGQVEMVFTLAFSRLYLREAVRRADVTGLVLVVAGVVLILAGR
ncbi:EamA family transporter [Elioraea rosea]|uniref:EamA family transporter n=1 Tax=Elioraea rosea TaxID=2492390 RepID=UPI0011834782|nr:EamA family transporter [Elioraea rosea]